MTDGLEPVSRARQLRLALAVSLALVPAAVRGQDQPAAAPAQPAQAQAPPTISLLYRELQNREDYKFRLAGAEQAKPVGDLNFDYPVGTFAAAGFEPALRTYCVDPLVPIYAGQVYPFAVEPINLPKSYGLPDTEEGRKTADRKATYLRELYGRYYADTQTNPQLASPAFQVAVWEIVHEQELPDGPMPLNLFTGTNRANYANEADAPAFVQQAQTYLLGLKGDDSSFGENPLLARTELVRFTGLPNADGFAAQSQLALRGIAAAPGGGDSGQIGGGGGGGLGGRLGGGGLGGLGGGFGGLGGYGGIGGFPFIGGGGNSGTTTNTVSAGTPTAPATVSTPGTSSPSEGSPSSAPSNNPTTSGTPSTPSTPGTPSSPTTPTTPNAVPAPPAVLLGLIGAGFLAARRVRAALAARA